MADNTFNFDLDAPAVPTLTLDPVEAPAAEEKQPEPAAAPEAEPVSYTHLMLSTTSLMQI